MCRIRTTTASPAPHAAQGVGAYLRLASLTLILAWTGVAEAGIIQDPQFSDPSKWTTSTNGNMAATVGNSSGENRAEFGCDDWNPTAGWWARVSQTITIPSGFKITIYRYLPGSTECDAWRFRVKVDSRVIYEEMPPQGTAAHVSGDISVNLSMYPGVHILTFELACVSSYVSNVKPAYGSSAKNIRELSTTFIHMTDTHVYDATQTGSGDPNGSIFSAAMQEIAGMRPKPAFVAITGDLVDFGAGAGGQSNYSELTGKLFKAGNRYYADAAFTIPVYMTPGNHDPRSCRACVYGSDYVNYDNQIDAYMPHADPRLTAAQQRAGRNYAVTVDDTLLIFMDSGYDAGINALHPNGSGLSDAQWSWLTGLINLRFPRKIIFMHHVAIDASGQWCDMSSFGTVYKWDATITYHWRDFVYLLRFHPEIVVLTGHEHQNVVCDSYGAVVDSNAPGVGRAVQTGAAFQGCYREITPSGWKILVSRPKSFTSNRCPSFNGTYRIVNRLSGQALDVPGGSFDNGVQLIQWPYHGGNNQRWTISPNGDGTYKIKNVNSLKDVDVSGGSVTNGTPIIQYWDNGGSSQKWQINDCGGGYFKIICKSTQKAMVVENASTAYGAKIIEWTYNASGNDEWAISPP